MFVVCGFGLVVAGLQDMWLSVLFTMSVGLRIRSSSREGMRFWSKDERLGFLMHRLFQG